MMANRRVATPNGRIEIVLTREERQRFPDGNTILSDTRERAARMAVESDRRLVSDDYGTRRNKRKGTLTLIFPLAAE